MPSDKSIDVITITEEAVTGKGEPVITRKAALPETPAAPAAEADKKTKARRKA